MEDLNVSDVGLEEEEKPVEEGGEGAEYADSHPTAGYVGRFNAITCAVFLI